MDQTFSLETSYLLRCFARAVRHVDVNAATMNGFIRGSQPHRFLCETSFSHFGKLKMCVGSSTL